MTDVIVRFKENADLRKTLRDMGDTTFAEVVSPPAGSAFTLSSAATTNLTAVKAAPGTLYSIAASNAGAAAAFLKIYNKATIPTLASDTPLLTVPIPAASVLSVSLGPLGLPMSAGIAIAITNLVGDTDATAVALNQVKPVLVYR